MPHVFYTMSSGPSFKIPLVVVVILLLPFFLGVNLLGVGLAPLGGMLGGYVKARISPQRATLPEQTGEQLSARSGSGILVMAIIAILLAVIVTAAGLLYVTGAFAAISG